MFSYRVEGLSKSHLMASAGESENMNGLICEAGELLGRIRYIDHLDVLFVFVSCIPEWCN